MLFLGLCYDDFFSICLMLSSRLYYRYFGQILFAPAASLRYYDCGQIVSCLHRTSTLIIFCLFGVCGRSAVCTFVTWAIFFNLAADRYSRDFGSVFSCLRRASIVILAHCFYTYGEPLNNVI